MTTATASATHQPGRADAPDDDGDTLRAQIGRGNCRVWRRPDLGMVYRLNYPRKHLVLVAGDLLDDRVWAAMDEDAATFAEIGWAVRVLPAPLRGKVAVEPDSPSPAAPAGSPRGTAGAADPHADANRRAAASFARWCEENPAKAREVMGRMSRRQQWYADVASASGQTEAEDGSASGPPTGLNLNPPFHPDGRVFTDAEIAAIAAGNPHLLRPAPADDETAADEPLPTGGRNANAAVERTQALAQLRLVGGLLAVAGRLAGQYGQRHDGCGDGCCYPFKSLDPLEPDDAARDESVARRKLAQTVAHLSGWAADAMAGVLPADLHTGPFCEIDAARLIAFVESVR